mgnify:CR=1 FL=1
MKQSLTLLVALAALWVFPSSARAQVSQPDGTVIPTRTSTDGPSVGDILGGRGETNLTPPRTPFDAQANAQPNPQTFRPGCRISFTVIARYASDLDAFGWYNVVPGRTTPPPAAERYTIVPAANMDSPMAMGGRGFRATLDIGSDARYTGGEIGFFVHNTSDNNVFYTERRYQPTTVPGFFYTVIYDSRVTPGGFYFTWEDLLRDNDNDFNDLIVLVDNLTCSGGGATCMVPGAMGACASGTLQCRNAALTCVSTITPSAERCDGIDNNCNGMTDEGDGLCQTNQVCDRGVCVSRCLPELGCLPGFVCSTRGTCVEAACATQTCPAGQVCRGGACRAPCEGAVCPRGQVCRQDRCLDACAGLTCDSDQVCVAGVCQPRCPCRRCAANETCGSDGICVANDCARVTCGAGTYCMGGRCVDTCTGVVCPGGGVCVAGQCVNRSPDGGLPDGGRPDGGAPDGGVTAPGGDDGGCSCRGAGAVRARGGGLVFVMLALALARRSHRRVAR